MKKIQQILLLLCLMAGLSWQLEANNLRVNNVSYNLAAGTVTFDLAWDNSWRIDGMGSPNHWDAAWVFVKWRDCNAAVTTGWTHGTMSTTIGNHSLGNLQATQSDGTVGALDAAPNNTGIMLRQNTVGLYPARGATSVTLRISNLPAAGTYDLRVFGTEMVFVPQAAYILGGISESQPLNVGGTPVVIEDENAITLRYYSTSTVTLPAAYPKGYDAFYCMKYEISQDQYAAFLNTILPAAQTAHFPNQFNNYRHRIQSGGTPPFVYYSDRPDRACNYLAWTDVLAFLDWSCLRPMSEMEYEKACRGAGPYVGGYAWGTTDIVQTTALGTPEDGTELVLTPNANVNFSNIVYSGGDGGRGPIRVGIYATSATTSRLQTGATYFGIMEMSGNVWEAAVPVHTDAIFIGYDGQWGNGYLDAATHNADVTNWPNVNCAIANNACYHSLRGGSFSDATTRLRLADRYYYYYRYNSRETTTGGRGVR